MANLFISAVACVVHFLAVVLAVMAALITLQGDYPTGLIMAASVAYVLYAGHFVLFPRGAR